MTDRNDAAFAALHLPAACAVHAVDAARCHRSSDRLFRLRGKAWMPRNATASSTPPFARGAGAVTESPLSLLS